MSAAPVPALPPDVLVCIAHAALAAEGSDAQSWARLSLVCHLWRRSLHGE